MLFRYSLKKFCYVMSYVASPMEPTVSYCVWNAEHPSRVGNECYDIKYNCANKERCGGRRGEVGKLEANTSNNIHTLVTTTEE